MDILCVQAIYMPLLRQEIFDFVDSWNNHYIRKQRNRPDHPTGRPYMMYFHPGKNIESFGASVDARYLQILQHDVEDYGTFRLY